MIAQWLYRQNHRLTVSRYRLHRGLSSPLRFLSVADLHGTVFGEENRALLSAAAALSPDVIVLPGDTVSADLHNLDETVRLIERLGRTARVFVIPGNHELRSGQADWVLARYAQAGAVVLNNERHDTEINGVQLHILGLCEGTAVSRRDYLRAAVGTLRHADCRGVLAALERQSGLRVVLSHFPEKFGLIGELSYDRFGFDVMFAGHAHGGQWRLPLLGGLYAPGQGLLPRYDAGAFGKPGGPVLLLSRGLGNDGPIPRIGNPPELLLLTVD